MVLLSLGAEALVRLMQGPERPEPKPDLSWLLYGPEAPGVLAGGENGKAADELSRLMAFPLKTGL